MGEDENFAPDELGARLLRRVESVSCWVKMAGLFQTARCMIDSGGHLWVMAKSREFNVIIKRDSEGQFLASVPDLKGCHTQAKSLDTLMKRILGVIELCLEDEAGHLGSADFVGVQRIRV